MAGIKKTSVNDEKRRNQCRDAYEKRRGKLRNGEIKRITVTLNKEEYKVLNIVKEIIHEKKDSATFRRILELVHNDKSLHCDSGTIKVGIEKSTLKQLNNAKENNESVSDYIDTILDERKYEKSEVSTDFFEYFIDNIRIHYPQLNSDIMKITRIIEKDEYMAAVLLANAIKKIH